MIERFVTLCLEEVWFSY